MRHLFLSLLLVPFTMQVLAADGDTTTVRAHDGRDIGWWGAYDDWGVFPPSGNSYRKVLLHFTMGCASTGCSDWDYTVQIDLRHRTGALDSTLQQAPSFTVNGAQVQTLSYTTEHTFTTSWNGSDVDTLWTDTLLVILYENPEDPFAATDTLEVFPADLTYDVFDAEGNVMGTGLFAEEGLLELSLTDVYTVFEVVDDYELGRAITPYGGYMANGQQGYNSNWHHTYTYDVTAYQHLLHDSVEFRAFYGGWSSGFSVTLDFEMVEGTPPMDVLRVNRVYDSGPGGFNYPNPGTFEASSVPASTIDLLPGTQGAIGRMFVTGHGQAGEFTSGIYYYVKVNGATLGQQEIWKGDCGMNAIYPQGGTWVYDRANWCPGEAVPVFDHNVSSNITGGQANTVNVDFTAFNPSNAASYILEFQLIEHAAPNFALDAEVWDIITPSVKDIHRRSNPNCGSARIVIRNSGSTALTSATITYGLEGGASQTFNWSGNLGFLEKEEVELPTMNDWGGGHRTFFATITAPNGGTDGYSANDTYLSPFVAPDVITGTEAIILWVQSNNFGSHNMYWIYDDAGNEVFSRTALANNTLYKDTVYLPHGCYRFHLTDAQDNGLQWWAATNQGSGYARIRKLGSSATVKTFNADFGSEISYWFTMGAPLGTEETLMDDAALRLWPNPSSNGADLHVNLQLQRPDDVRMELLDMTGRTVWTRQMTGVDAVDLNIATHGLQAGIYLMRATARSGQWTGRVVLN
ncbi:MAG: T9SS type A sorting domain-containing protein [Flavobacteriales bacterium]|nr:T9SS type A sorting domain-containing protein [Flavobacteriales bacterium]